MKKKLCWKKFPVIVFNFKFYYGNVEILVQVKVHKY